MTEKGSPKIDGSGKGTRANRGRGGCTPPRDTVYSAKKKKMVPGDDEDEIAGDSKYFEDWIAGCIRKHVKGSEAPKMTKEQCIAAAYKKLRAGEITRRSNDSLVYIPELDLTINVDAGNTVEMATGALRYVSKAHVVIANLIPKFKGQDRVKLEVARDNLKVAIYRLQQIRK